MSERLLPNEFLLVAACCRWPLSEQAVAAIRGTCTAPIDWRSVLRIVKRHRVIGLVHHALLVAQIDVPTDIATKLASAVRKNAQRCVMLAAETVRLQRVFDTAGVPVVVLKGAALAQLAFNSLSLKGSKDIDLLVPPDRAEDAFRLLEKDGYVLSQPAKYLDTAQWQAVVRYGAELMAVHHGRRLQVELRWRLTDNPLLVAGLDMFSSLQDVPMSQDVSLRTFGGDNHFAYLCIHGAGHGWSRLKWLADLNALVADKTKADIERLYRHAQATGSGLCAGQALLLCSKLLKLRLSNRLNVELERDWRLKTLLAMAMDVMVGPDAEIEVEERWFGSTRVTLMQFFLGRGWKFFFTQCQLASVRLGDVVSYPLPSSLHFLYPLLRFPLWVWRRSRGVASHLK